MEIKNRKVLVIGGWGLVGSAICHELAKEEPRTIVITSLRQSEAEEACEKFGGEYPTIEFLPEWGNIFVREPLKNLSRDELMNIKENRTRLLNDVLNPLNEDILENSTLYRIIQRHRPEIVIDCVNSATGLAYQDVYQTSYRLRNQLESVNPGDRAGEEFLDLTEQLMATQYIPQLIRHVQVLYEAMKRVGTRSYLKIGTSGTGGMGLNIP